LKRRAPKEARLAMNVWNLEPTAEVAKLPRLADDGLVPPEAEHQYEGDDRACDCECRNQHLRRVIGHHAVDRQTEDQREAEDRHGGVHEAVEVCVEPAQLAGAVEWANRDTSTGHTSLP
jgi:hypothetical protein